jgi:hypothetical protein
VWCFTATALKYTKTVSWTLCQNNWLVQHDNVLSHTRFFTREFLSETMWLSSLTQPIHWPPAAFLCFPDWRYQHFDTIEVIEAEMQAVLNTLTEHDFWDALKMAEVLGAVHTCRSGRLLWGWWWPVGAKLALTRWQHQSQKLWTPVVHWCFL